MQKFPEGYYNGETRDGYYISPMVKRGWAGRLEVLSEIDRVCKKYGIIYFADFGTLLGAVRHKGYIPWDDDLDIAMKREDFMKFVEIVPLEFDKVRPYSEDEVSSGRLQCHTLYTTENIYIPQGTVGTGNSINFEDSYLKRYHGCPYALYIDIFILDYFPGINKETETVLDIISILSQLGSSDENWDEKGRLKEAEAKNLLSGIQNLTGYVFDEAKDVRKQIFLLMDKLASMYGRDECDYIRNYMWMTPGTDETRLIRKEWYDEVVYLPFENISIPCPAEYDKILTKMYGDYMTPVYYGGHGNVQKKLLEEQQIFKGEDWEKELEEFVSKYD